MDTNKICENSSRRIRALDRRIRSTRVTPVQMVFHLFVRYLFICYLLHVTIKGPFKMFALGKLVICHRRVRKCKILQCYVSRKLIFVLVSIIGGSVSSLGTFRG